MWQHAARLRTPAVAGWLTDIVPPWLVTAVRPRPAPVPWAEMLRAGIAICVPMAAGIASGQRVLGLLTAMGGLLGIVVDNGGAYPTRLRRVGSAAVFGGAAGLTIGSLIHGHGWIAVVALIVVAGTSALLSAISDIGSVTGLQLLVYSSLGLGALGALRPWWHTALGFVLGTVWALILTVPGWLISPRAAEQRSVAAVYHALAAQLRAIGTSGFTEARRAGTAAMNTAYDTVLTARSTAGGRNEQMRRLVALLNQANLLAEAVSALGLEGNRPPPAVADAIDGAADA
ncbi:MAG: FUSC family membrane protein, partial [Streptosporangiaceae bacterium]